MGPGLGHAGFSRPSPAPSWPVVSTPGGGLGRGEEESGWWTRTGISPLSMPRLTRWTLRPSWLRLTSPLTWLWSKTALEGGKHVLVEKPFAPSVAEAREAVDLAESLGLTLMVSQNYRFFPAVRAVQQLMSEDRLGPLLHIDLDFRRHSPPSRTRSRGHRDWDQPLLLDMSIHHFDLLRAVIGTEPTSVYCRTHNPAWAGFKDPPEGSATIDFANDVTVSYRGSWIHPGPKTLWAGEWRMEFENGELWWTSRGDLQSDAPGRGLALRPLCPAQCCRLAAPATD